MFNHKPLRKNIILKLLIRKFLTNLLKILKSACPIFFCSIFFLTAVAFGDVTSDSLQSVSAGYGYTCGVTTDISKSVYCWGRNQFGQLGNNSTTNSKVPVKVVGGEQGGNFLTGVSQISLGYYYSCGLTAGGEVYCWGNNDEGQLGNNSTTQSLVPVKVVGGEQGGNFLTELSQVSLGNYHSCGLTVGGEVYCWGDNSSGQLGNNSTTSSKVPVRVLGGAQGGAYLTGVSQVSSKDGHTCGVTTGGEVYCWGNNDEGQLGNDSRTQSLVPVKVVGGEQGGNFLTELSQVSLGNYHSCGLTVGGEVYCWGDNSSGQLGNNSTTKSLLPVRVLGGAQGGAYLGNISQISLNGDWSCGVTTSGEVYCWGDNGSGQLGNNSTIQSLVPVKVFWEQEISQVSAGEAHTCALTPNGSLICWGNNVVGQLGNVVPVKVVGGEHGGTDLIGVSQVSAGGGHSCGVTTVGEVYCWGLNDCGQLGNNSITSSQVPVSVLGGAQGGIYLGNISQVSAGNGHSCGVTMGGEVYCWGNNSGGQLGNNSTTSSQVPVRVLGGAQGGTYLGSISQVSLGPDHSCGLTTGGEVYCWGRNQFGGLGNNSTTNSKVPVKVVGGEQGGNFLTGVSQISLGYYYSCGLTAGGEIYCWGWNSYGQLGNNSTTKSLLPVRVLGGAQGGSYLTGVSQVSAGIGDVCGVTIVGEVYCWGDNSGGQLGNNSTTSSKVPVRVLGGAQGGAYLGNISQISLNGGWSCGVTTSGEVYCWGDNGSGQLGNGKAWYETPQEIYDGSGVAPCTLSCCAQWNYSTIGDTCSNGVGACLVSGQMSCEGVGVTGAVMCNAIAGTPVEEICSDYDDDCDGVVNEGLDCPTNTPTFTNTITPTFTNTITATFTPTLTNTVTNTSTTSPTIDDKERIVTPQISLDKPSIDKYEEKDIKIKFEKFDGASLKNPTKKDVHAQYKYLIHIRKLKRLGHKDKNYQLGRKKLCFRKSNHYTFKNLDKGIYSIRYRVIITKNNVTRRTKWSGKNLIVF